LQEYVGFILSVNEALKGKKTSSLKPFNERIEKVITLLDSLDRLIEETPPTEQPQRFGNKSFRVWIDKLKEVFQSKTDASNQISTKVLMCLEIHIFSGIDAP